jgi:hypothetical protein
MSICPDSCKGAWSSRLQLWILTWNISWHYQMMREDFLWKGLLMPEDGAVRDSLLEKSKEVLSFAIALQHTRAKLSFLSLTDCQGERHPHRTLFIRTSVHLGFSNAGESRGGGGARSSPFSSAHPSYPSGNFSTSACIVSRQLCDDSASAENDCETFRSGRIDSLISISIIPRVNRPALHVPSAELNISHSCY